MVDLPFPCLQIVRIQFSSLESGKYQLTRWRCKRVGSRPGYLYSMASHTVFYLWRWVNSCIIEHKNCFRRPIGNFCVQLLRQMVYEHLECLRGSSALTKAVPKPSISINGSYHKYSGPQLLYDTWSPLFLELPSISLEGRFIEAGFINFYYPFVLIEQVQYSDSVQLAQHLAPIAVDTHPWVSYLTIAHLWETF